MGGTLFLANCGSTPVSLDYQPSLSRPVPGTTKVAAGRFANMRRQGSSYLGTVRSPIGTPIETLTTNVPIEDVVRNAFAHGLSVRGMFAATGSSPYVINGEILDLHCDQVIKPAAYVSLRVNLVQKSTGQVLFSKIYEAEREGTAFVPGSGSPVPRLRELTSRALQDAVDKALDDRMLRNRLSAASNSRSGTPDIL
ncbi:hypothetical protein BH11VER1_BH11VER1_38960 [soil metagenome]